MSEVKAQLNNLRIAPRKVRAVANLIKGKNVTEALDQMEFMIKKPTQNLSKLLHSAVTSAENTFNMAKDNLFIKKIVVDEGVKLKRFRAKGFGRAAAIQKKTSHISIILDERVPGLKRSRAKVQEVKDKNAELKKETNLNRDKKPEIKREIAQQKKSVLGNLGKKIFMRKSI